MLEVQAPKAKKRLKIGFVHRFDARNIRSWSGIFYFMSQALEKHVGEVVYLGPDDSKWTKFIVDNTARVNRYWQRLTGKILATDKNRVLSNRLGRFFERQIEANACDILFAPVASVEIANMRTTLPLVYYSDITWAQIVDYYPEFTSVSEYGMAEGERIEAAAILKANAAVYPSEWAVESACKDYGASRETTCKVSFGANLNDPPTRSEALNRSVTRSLNHGGGAMQIRLLLVGVDWVRKGGAIAFECLTSLLDSGVDAQLTILGCTPPAGFEHPNFRVIPFLSKHDPQQRRQIEQLFLDAHFMLLPTRADATPIVISEASAFGLPILATDTGGLGGSISPGVNGYLLPYKACGRAYADKIIEVIADPAEYKALVISSRNEYEQRLNWDAWAISMRGVMERVLNRKIDSAIEAAENAPIPPGESSGSAESVENLTAEVSHI
jgi:glycosyltransferase involved in cell wall biosynthesis